MKYALYDLMLAEDPISFNLFYMPKYFHIFIYFISQDIREISSAYKVTLSRRGKLGPHRHVHLCQKTF